MSGTAVAVAPFAPVVAPLAGAGEHLVVVVAHPDDETFGCGSLIAQSAAAGARVTVICATRGEAGERRPDPETDGWPLGLVREVELRRAAAVLGVSAVEVLDHRDSGFDGPVSVGALVRVPLARLADQLEWRLGRLRADVVLTLDGSDGHRDHVHVRDALGLAVARLWCEPRLVHASLANSLMREWAAVTAERDPDSAYLTLALDDLGRPDAELTALDTSAVLDVRERAIACHRSQASPFDGLPRDLRRRFLTTDHVVVAAAAPDAGQVGSRAPATAVARKIE